MLQRLFKVQSAAFMEENTANITVKNCAFVSLALLANHEDLQLLADSTAPTQY